MLRPPSRPPWRASWQPCRACRYLFARFWTWYMGPTDGNPKYREALGKELNGKAGWKRIVEAAMASRGRPVADIKPVTDEGGRATVRAYNGVAWR